MSTYNNYATQTGLVRAQATYNNGVFTGSPESALNYIAQDLRAAQRKDPSVSLGSLGNDQSSQDVAAQIRKGIADFFKDNGAPIKPEAIEQMMQSTLGNLLPPKPAEGAPTVVAQSTPRAPTPSPRQ